MPDRARGSPGTFSRHLASGLQHLQPHPMSWMEPTQRTPQQVVTTAPHTGAPRAPAPTQRLQPGLQDLVMLTAPQGPARLNIQATVTLSGHNVNATLPARASCCSTPFPFLVHFPHLQSLPPDILPKVLLHFPSLEQTLPESRLYHFCSLLLPWQPELAAVQKTG